MSSPIQPESVTIDDIDRVSAPPPLDFKQIKMDGDDVPEDLRGKSVEELMQYSQRLSESLKMSERARLQSEQMTALATRSAPPPVEAPPEPPELTDEQLAELHQSDPIKAIKLMQQQAIRVAASNYDSRLGSLAQSATAAAETEARRRYSDEFEVLGSEISTMVQQLPNAREVLTTPEAWERLISLVRGSPGNFERIIQRRAAKSGAPTLETARKAQAEDAGVSMASAVRTPNPRSVAQLDDTAREIAKNLGISPEEYVRWSQV